MNLSISNIAWPARYDKAIYSAMRELGYTGLELAPTRIFPQDPYDHSREAADFAQWLKKTYGLFVCSLQSIWYGRTERLFGSSEERQALLTYTCQAIDFAAAMHCPNLVFGSPKNRQRPEGSSLEPVLDFFRQVAEYAAAKGTTLSMEPNPPLYHTNFINTTDEAWDLVRQIHALCTAPSSPKGFAINLDLGTILENQESLSSFDQWLPYVNHIHISEPSLVRLKKDHLSLYQELATQVKNAWSQKGWQGYLSIEMGCQESLADVVETLELIRQLF